MPQQVLDYISTDTPRQSPIARIAMYVWENWLQIGLAVLLSLPIPLLLPLPWNVTGLLIGVAIWGIATVPVFFIVLAVDWMLERLMENNYRTLLIGRYLRKRRIAWVSLIAVTLCTALVIVVISVMGGWLKMFREQFHGIVGDVVVSRMSLNGFPHYQEMIDRIRNLPDVKGATPSLQTFGLVNVYGQIHDGVQVVGYDISEISKITRFGQSLHRQFEVPTQQVADPATSQQERDAADLLLKRGPTFDKPHPDAVYKEQFPKSRVDVTEWPGIIVGSGVVGISRNEDGTFDGREGLLNAWVRLTVLGVSDDMTRVDAQAKTERMYWIVDDSRTRLWQYDQQTVYVPFDVLQRDLGMDEHKEDDETIAARAHGIQVGLKNNADPAAVAQQVQKIVDEVLLSHGIVFSARDPVRATAWFDTQPTKDFLDAVQKEVVLVTFLFGLISIVAIFLIFCIFFMIVVEKTKDIGIVKSVGATSWGVAQIFLGYGLAIGIVGGLLGLLAAWGVVANINWIHHKLGEWMGITMWDAKTYAFDTIPDKMDPQTVTIIVMIAILSSLLGAVIPAIRAARMNPVEALRWE